MKPNITFTNFSKLDLRIAKIVEAVVLKPDREIEPGEIIR